MTNREKKPTRKPAKLPAAATRRSVSEFRNGKPVRWVYVVPEELVRNLRKRISRNPNSQTNRALVALGLDTRR